MKTSLHFNLAIVNNLVYLSKFSKNKSNLLIEIVNPYYYYQLDSNIYIMQYIK